MTTGAETNATGSRTPLGDNRIEIFSAVAACMSGLAAPFNNSFRFFAYTLAALNGILLLVVAVMRINAGLKSKKHSLPLVSLIVLLCAVSLSLAGWSIAHPPTEAAPATSGLPAEQQPERPDKKVTYTNSTSGISSPIFNGNGNTFVSGEKNGRSGKKHK
jgi:hypothetical protein